METVTSSRLYYRLSEFIFSCKKNDVDYSIATLLLEKIREFPDVNISEVAYLANTTPASVSRFCKKIGYPSFFDLKNDIHLSGSQPFFDYSYKNTSLNEQKANFLKQSNEMDQLIADNLNNAQLELIANACQSVKKIAIISSHYSMGTANLFRELLSQKGIHVVEINRGAHEDMIATIFNTYDMVFVISLTGEWSVQMKDIITQPRANTTVLLTLSAHPETLPTFDHIVSFANFDFILSSTYYSQRVMMLWTTFLVMLINNNQ